MTRFGHNPRQVSARFHRIPVYGLPFYRQNFLSSHSGPTLSRQRKSRLFRDGSYAQAGYFKTHFSTYAKAAEVVGEAPSQILFVANHAFDCIGAKAAGMRTAFIDRRKRPFGETPHRPDLIVPDFAALAEALGA